MALLQRLRPAVWNQRSTSILIHRCGREVVTGLTCILRPSSVLLSSRFAGDSRIQEHSTFRSSRRCFSSQSASNPAEGTRSTANAVDSVISPSREDQEDDEIVLYHRASDTSRTLLLLRSGCLFSTCYTGYWMWYNTDFIPLVNQSPIADLHINPMFGIGGLAFSIGLSVFFLLNSQRLVSTLAIRPSTRELVLYGHRLPLLRPSLSPRRFFIPKRQTTTVTAPLALSSTDAKKLAGSFHTYRGHLKLGSGWPRYTMDIQTTEDVVQPDLLWDALMQPAALLGHGVNLRTVDKGEDDDDDAEIDDLGQQYLPWKRRKSMTAKRKMIRNTYSSSRRHRKRKYQKY